MTDKLKTWQWYRAEEEDVKNLLYTQVKQLILRGNNRRQQLSAFRSMYLDLADPNYSLIGAERIERSPFHLIQGAVDSTHAQVTTQRPRPLIVTIGGNGGVQRRAKLRQRWIDGEYERLNVYNMISRAAKAALIFGTAYVKCSTFDERNILEPVWCGDLWTDPLEERHEAVRSLYQVHRIDRDVLADLFPEKLDEIDRINEEAPQDTTLFPDLNIEKSVETNMVSVIEAWRLPVSRKTPGRYVIICDGGVLAMREWTRKSFPFAKYVWADVPMRYSGQGMVERGVGIQQDLNETCAIVRDSFGQLVPKVVVSRNSGIDEEQLNDDVGGIVYCDGDVNSAMQVFSPTINPVVMQHESSLAARAYQVLGVSQLSAGAVKPSGIDSGKGMQVYNDSAAGRFNPQGQGLEQFSMDIATLLLDNAADIARESPSAAQRVYGGKTELEVVDYRETGFADAEDEIYVVRVMPVSKLSNSVSARVDEVARIQALKPNLSPQQIDELLDLPDTERFRDLESAGNELVNRAIDMALADEDVDPSEYWPQEYAVVRIAQAIQLAELNHEKPEGIARLRDLHAFVMSLMDPPADPVDEMAPPQGPPPMDPNNPMAAMPADPSAMPPEGGEMVI